MVDLLVVRKKGDHHINRSEEKKNEDKAQGSKCISFIASLLTNYIIFGNLHYFTIYNAINPIIFF